MRARIAASGVALAALVTLVAGCTFVTNQASTEHYDASDGVSAIIGDVHVANALLVIADDGEADGPNLVFTGVNTGDEPVTLSVQVDVDGDKVDQTVSLDPGSTEVGSGDDGQFVLPGVDAVAGSLVKVYFQYGSRPGRELQVPVFDGTWTEYEGLLPTPTPTPEVTLPVEPDDGGATEG